MKRQKTFKTALVFLAIVLLFSSCNKPPQKTEKIDFAMGTTIFTTYYGDLDNSDEILNSIIEKIKSADLIMSKNNENAEVYKLNHSDDLVLSDTLYNYIKNSAEIFSHSENKVSVSSGTLTECWGFDTSEFRVPSNAEILDRKKLCNDNTLIFDDQNKKIKTEKGQIINLGAVGKGAACDEAVNAFKESGQKGSLIVSVGGSVGICGENKRSVGIRNPFAAENEYFATIEIENGFVSTSGDYEKTFEKDGKSYHHILDLTTGYPVDGEITSVTVFSDKGYVSDALSTMCFALGIEKSCEVLKLYSSDAVFVKKDKTVVVTQGLKDLVKITNPDFKLVQYE
ncbi:MAG: FAD:protein FMN transferase [Oscillospiraceae bacterium]